MLGWLNECTCTCIYVWQLPGLLSHTHHTVANYIASSNH